MGHSRLRLCLAAAISVVPVAGETESTGDTRDVAEPVYELAPVVVTATRLTQALRSSPYAISAIDLRQRRMLETGISLDETLRSVPGLSISNRHNLSQGDRLAMRGIGSRASFGVRGIRILLDHIPLTMPDGQSQLGNLDLTSVGRVEIIRGLSSALYGNAGGGVIHYHTEGAHHRGTTVVPRLVIGSHELRRFQIPVTRVLGAHVIAGSLNILERDGYRQHSAGRSRGLNLVGRHLVGRRIALTSVVNLYDAPYLLNPSSLSREAADNSPTSARFFVRQQGAAKKVRQGQLGITATYHGPDSTRASITLYGLSRSLKNPVPGRIIDLDRSAYGLRSAMSGMTAAGPNPVWWTAGFDLEKQSDSRSEFGNLGLEDDLVDELSPAQIIDRVRRDERQLQQNETVSGFGPFVELRVRPHERVHLTAGGRYDRYRFRVDDEFLDDGIDQSGRRTMSKFSPAFGVSISPVTHGPLWSAFSLYANRTSGFQSPTTVELGNRPGGAGGFNPDLQPEGMTNTEIGVRGRSSDSQLSCDVAIFDLEIREMLIPFQAADSEEVFYRNAGRAKNRGAELWLQWSPDKRIRLDVAVTANDFHFDEFAVEGDGGVVVQLAGNEVPGVSPLVFYTGFAVDDGRTTRGLIDMRWSDRYYANDFNGPAPGDDGSPGDYLTDSGIVLDLRLARSILSGSWPLLLTLGIDNALASSYDGSAVPNAFGNRFFEPAPGRTFFVGFSVSGAWPQVQ